MQEKPIAAQKFWIQKHAKIEFAEDLTMPRLGYHIVTIRTGGWESIFAMGAMGDDALSDLS